MEPLGRGNQLSPTKLLHLKLREWVGVEIEEFGKNLERFTAEGIQAILHPRGSRTLQDKGFSVLEQEYLAFF